MAYHVSLCVGQHSLRSSLRAYLITNSSAPLDHLWNRLLIHLAARLSNRIDDGEVRLQGVQRGYSVLVGSGHLACGSHVPELIT